MLLQVLNPLFVPPNPPNAFFKVDVKILSAGKYIQNTLWYANDQGIVLPLDTQALDLLTYWVSQVAPQYAEPLPTTNKIDYLQCQAYDSNWNPGMSVPTVQIVNQPGGVSGEMSGRAQVMVVNFVLSMQNGILPIGRSYPKHPYIHYGPVRANAIDEEGDNQPGSYPTGILESMMNAITAPITGTMATYFPVRVGVTTGELQDPPTEDPTRTVAYILGAYIRERSSFRKSRNKG